MGKSQPAVRVFLTFMVAALSTAVATVDDETFRVVASIILSGLAAIGIVPPHIPTRTSIDAGVQPVNVVRDEEGVSVVEALLVVFLAVVILVVLDRLV